MPGFSGGVLLSYWMLLSDLQRAAWVAWAALNQVPDDDGGSSLVSGHDAFVTLMAPRLKAGLAVIPDPTGLGLAAQPGDSSVSPFAPQTWLLAVGGGPFDALIRPILVSAAVVVDSDLWLGNAGAGGGYLATTNSGYAIPWPRLGRSGLHAIIRIYDCLPDGLPGPVRKIVAPMS